MPQRIPDVSAATFAEQVLAASFQQPVLVEYWAPWCGPCRLLFPLLERIWPLYAGRLLIVKLDADAASVLAEQYEVRSLPTLQLFRNGRVVASKQGLMPDASLRQLLDAQLASESS